LCLIKKLTCSHAPGKIRRAGLDLPTFLYKNTMPHLNDLIVASDNLTPLTMALRAAIVFFATLILLRISGRRSFGQRSAFDLCITVLLGAILSRAIVGATPLPPTLAAGTMLVLLHRLIGILISRWPWFDDIISGPQRLLVKDGLRDLRQMRAGLITDRDIEAALHKRDDNATLADVARAILEKNGEITITLHSNMKRAK